MSDDFMYGKDYDHAPMVDTAHIANEAAVVWATLPEQDCAEGVPGRAEERIRELQAALANAQLPPEVLNNDEAVERHRASSEARAWLAAHDEALAAQLVKAVRALERCREEDDFYSNHRLNCKCDLDACAWANARAFLAEFTEAT